MQRSLIVLSTSALAVSAAAAAPAGADAKAKPPVVRSASPMSLAVGQTLTLRGTALRAGKAQTTVVFQRSGGKAIFARAAKATNTVLTVVVPSALSAQLPLVNGTAAPARFRLRVLTTRFGRGFTAEKRSPVIRPSTSVTPTVIPPTTATSASAPGAAAPGATPAPDPGTATTDSRPAEPEEPTATTADPVVTTADPAVTTTPVAGTTPVDPTPSTPATPACDSASGDGDADGDGLSNATERSIKTDPCSADSDGDGVNDYFEQRSALDLNSTARPYPGKRPYPNALDGTDVNTDFDGDGLTLGEESAAWVRTGSPRSLTYSDGSQFTGGLLRVGSTPGIDYNGNGLLSDDEKDVDDDGIGNWHEVHGGGQPSWWAAAFPLETGYPSRPFSGLDYLDADTDGDGLKDGADDEDHDGFTNAQELVRPGDWETTYVSTSPEHIGGTNARARVNPFNPCKPYYSSTCHLHPPFGAYPETEDWESPVHADGP